MERYIGWKKELRDPKEFSRGAGGVSLKDEIIEIYVFDDPKIVHYENRFTGLRRVSKEGYSMRWGWVNGDLEKKDNGLIISGKGFAENCWEKVNGDLKGLCAKIGISEMELKLILEDGH